MKALFIIHCQDPIYGASRSVGNLIRNLDADVDLMFPFKTKRDGITEEQIHAFYGPRVRRVWFLPQPSRLTIQPVHFTFRHHVKSAVKELLYLLARPAYRRIFRKGDYDFIHLNSATIYPMLDPALPMLIHIREAIREKQHFWNRRLRERLKDAHGVIYINKEARDACPVADTPSIVLVNPYDQTQVADVDVAQARERFGLTGNETVYAIIGNIFPFKGVDFIIRCFRRARLDNAVLLVAGADTNRDGYEEAVKREAADDPRIHFLGEIAEIDVVYRVVDYVVRGDSVPGAGRTVFESLYSGGGVILMGSREENLAPLELPPELAERVCFYPVRDEAGLIQALEQTQHHRFEQRCYRTNVPEYMDRFLAFLRDNTDAK